MIMKKLEVEKMEKHAGGWSLVCDIDWGFLLVWNGGDSFFGHFAVSKCRFEF